MVDIRESSSSGPTRKTRRTSAAAAAPPASASASAAPAAGCSPLLRLAALSFVLYSAWSVYFFVAFHRRAPSLLGGLPGGGDGLHAALLGYERRVEEYLAEQTFRDAGDGDGSSPDEFSDRAKRREDESVESVPIAAAAAAAERAAPGGNKSSSSNRFVADLLSAESYLSKHGPSQLRQTLSAYVEPPLSDVDESVPYDRGDKKNDQRNGYPPKFVTPLPLRSHGPEALNRFRYDRVQTCHDLPAKLPVDEGLLLDRDGNHEVPNVNNRVTIQDALKDATHCPVNADPFLPWIHDVFPSPDGRVVHFVAQNKRRCNTGNRFLEDIRRLEPQAALMQPISVERVSEGTAVELAPELWTPKGEEEGGVGEGEGGGGDDGSTGVVSSRYRLAPHEESDADGQFTRFICRFHYTDASGSDPSGGSSPPRTVVVGETLSEFPINYELANYRKGMPNYHSMLTPKGKDNAQFWLSNFRFDCPVPDNVDGLSDAIVRGDGILSDGTPLIHVDVVPIRTSPRFGAAEVYFTEELAGPKKKWGSVLGDKHGWSERAGYTNGAPLGFDATARWGDKNVVPRVEASGRWANIPICRPPPPAGEVKKESGPAGGESKQLAVAVGADGEVKATTEKTHTLVACLWASAAYTTRGHENTITDSEARLMEWIEWNLLIGFDHVYVYDNTGAHTDAKTLEPILSKFSPSEVTRIDWPSRVCNNNVPAHENTGERSSQYAAESSCRQRYGPHTEWLAAIDPDEYLVPMGKYDSLQDVVRDAEKKGTNILGFKSTRAVPVVDTMIPNYEDKDCGSAGDPKCLQKSPDKTFLETYNCDMEKTPKPQWAQRAKKQMYRPDYVLSHYVHYSTITQGLVQTCAKGSGCPHHYQEKSPSERFTDEVNEAVMIHSKTLVPRDSVDWKERCKPGFKEKHQVKCRVGFPSPNNDAKSIGKGNKDGMKYNCYSNEKVSKVWLPRLKSAMEKRNASNNLIKRK